MLEGLRCLREMGAHVTLLLNDPIPAKFSPLFETHRPNIHVIPGFAGGPFQPRSWFDRMIERAIRAVRRIKNLRSAIRAASPDVIIANEPRESRSLWLFSLGGLIRVPPIVTFVHGSPFQFANDPVKYALVFRRHLLKIRDADPL